MERLNFHFADSCADLNRENDLAVVLNNSTSIIIGGAFFRLPLFTKHVNHIQFIRFSFSISEMLKVFHITRILSSYLFHAQTMWFTDDYYYG